MGKYEEYFKQDEGVDRLLAAVCRMAVIEQDWEWFETKIFALYCQQHNARPETLKRLLGVPMEVTDEL